ncbi:hypothetical protein [Ideonella sp. A 288]|uniref:hypothetical protein n=1 Tax=Ideonella sp. A 288 TaxID=1962181 RepID=UPI0018FEBDBB|nr:hypothetical protein [Ideonella sp. A 288]
MKRSIVLALAATVCLAACSKGEQAAAPATTAAAPAAPAPAAAPAAPSVPSQVRSLEPAPNTGKVMQVQHAGSYTYAEVEGPNGQRAWIAGTVIAVNVGDEVQWGDYSVMRNFTAKSIGRTFDSILFVNSWGKAGAPVVATPVHGSMPTPTVADVADANNTGVVKSVAVAGGYSYVEVDRGGKVVWVAAMETPMKPGDKVQWQGGAEMRNFNAKSLGRTFDQIVFAQAIAVVR